MRHWCVIALIVLLPWRAWAGDAMMLSMSGLAGHEPAAVAPHCTDHQVAAVDVAEGVSTHAVCDICNGPAMAVSVPPALDAGPLPHARQASDPVRFVSAVPLPGHKPPIF